MRYILWCATLLFLSSCSTHFYIVRHAEKAGPATGMNTSDPELSTEGKSRANSLSAMVKKSRLREIFATNTIRAKSTAQPTAAANGIGITTYGTVDSIFILMLKKTKSNTLIVGHSNTVDDIVNRLTGARHVPGDLPDTVFDRFYIVTRKGSKYRFKELGYGVSTPLLK